ncbi:Dj-1 family protein [Mycena sanguinolenta]|uniref:Dj-1 family protein n=1 Tax=Mycena sanguinolenta TaxID=230812 RepID=A0A8H7DF00_9AGAR|nr:Dj-1 family protein [Mycena sanguinolenta]
MLSSLFTIASLATAIAAASNYISGPPPVSYGLLLFPTFEQLDVNGPLEALYLLSLQFPMNLAIIAETLDPVSSKPLPVNNTFNSNVSQSVVPTNSFADVPPIEVLLIPGGFGAEVPEASETTIAFIRDIFPSLKYLITVCTGAGLAARAGVLDGRNATTNKAEWAKTIALGPKTNWIPHARWVVDGNVWTTSGVSAGTDGVLAFIEEQYGAEAATRVANTMEWVRITNSSDDPFAGLYGL